MGWPRGCSGRPPGMAPGDPYLEPFWPGAAQKGLDLKPVRLDSPSGLAQGLLI